MIDLTNKIINSLKVIEPIGTAKNGSKLWKCQCECGKIINVTSQDLIHNRKRSCGCKQRVRGAVSLNQFNTNIGVIRANTLKSNNTTGVTGVSYVSKTGKYRATISFRGKHKHLGVFDTLEQARKARQIAEEERLSELETLIKSNK